MLQSNFLQVDFFQPNISYTLIDHQNDQRRFIFADQHKDLPNKIATVLIFQVELFCSILWQLEKEPIGLQTKD